MKQDPVIFDPIGFVRSPFKEPKDVPIQTRSGKGIRGSVEVKDEFAEGLSDLEGFSHIIMITHLHLIEGYKLKVVPFLDNVERGVFATRAPRRPNPIGLHIVRLLKIEANILQIEDIDMVDGTPVLDIKPYIPRVDERDNAELGWLKDKLERFDSGKADDRFA